jgi:hypothetical protein
LIDLNAAVKHQSNHQMLSREKRLQPILPRNGEMREVKNKQRNIDASEITVRLEIYCSENMHGWWWLVAQKTTYSSEGFNVLCWIAVKSTF